MLAKNNNRVNWRREEPRRGGGGGGAGGGEGGGVGEVGEGEFGARKGVEEEDDFRSEFAMVFVEVFFYVFRSVCEMWKTYFLQVSRKWVLYENPRLDRLLKTLFRCVHASL